METNTEPLHVWMAQTDSLPLISPVDFTLFVNKTIKWKVLWTGYDHCGLTGVGQAPAPSLQMGVGWGWGVDYHEAGTVCWVQSKLSSSSVVYYRPVSIFINRLDKDGKLNSYTNDTNPKDVEQH